MVSATASATSSRQGAATTCTPMGKPLELTRDALRHFWDADQASWPARLAAEQDNLREALGWARETDPAFGLGLAKRLWQFWLQWGQFAEGRAWLAAMLSATDPEAQRPERAEALNGAASLAFVQGDYPAALDLYRQSLALGEALGDEESVAIVLNNLANVLRTQGDLGAARAHYQRSLALREKLGLRRGVASSLCNLGFVALKQGDADARAVLVREPVAAARAGWQGGRRRLPARPGGSSGPARPGALRRRLAARVRDGAGGRRALRPGRRSLSKRCASSTEAVRRRLCEIERRPVSTAWQRWAARQTRLPSALRS